MHKIEVSENKALRSTTFYLEPSDRLMTPVNKGPAKNKIPILNK